MYGWVHRTIGEPPVRVAIRTRSHTQHIKPARFVTALQPRSRGRDYVASALYPKRFGFDPVRAVVTGVTAYYGGGSCEGLTVLDPFLGGGVMLLEAARLGANVLGVDVEPVAAVVSDFQGRLPQLPTLSPDMERLWASAGAELAPFYRAVDADGREERVLHAFWVQVLACATCQTRFDAHPSFRLAWDDAQSFPLA